MNHYYLPLKFDPENNSTFEWLKLHYIIALVFGSMQLWPFTSYKMS